VPDHFPRGREENLRVTPAGFADALTSPFAKLWSGQYSLPKAFWLFFIAGTFLVPIGAMVIYVPLALAGMPQVKQPLAVISMVVYPLFAAVGVWRSANARPFQRWPVAAAAAKFGVIVWLLTIASRVTGMGFFDVLRLAGYHP
jgi:hypothetical protein